jgi:3-deoxy-D-arabino-heptulosonate 7-phosphate (DAHP) synthase class II
MQPLNIESDGRAFLVEASLVTEPPLVVAERIRRKRKRLAAAVALVALAVVAIVSWL